jgi:hypothetical protein
MSQYGADLNKLLDDKTNTDFLTHKIRGRMDNWYGAEFNRWLNGELRTDGWVSDWQKEQLRRRKEEMGQRQFVKAKQTERPQIERVYSDPGTRREIVRRSLHKRRLRLKAEGICVDCGKYKVKEGCTSCEPCLKARYQRQKRKRQGLKEAA